MGPAHHHAHDGHGHSHARPTVSDRIMGAALALTLTFVGVEATCGWFGRSLALLSDAGHNFADAAALAFSWYALRVADKPSHHGMTYGYHRVGILAALANALSLVVIAFLIIWEAVGRIRNPEPVSGGLMIAVALGAVVINTVISLWLHKGSKDDVNVRSAYLHMVGDAVSGLGVVVAGAIVVATHASMADPVVSFLIASLILWSGWGVLRECVTVLLEGTPVGTDMPAVIGAIRNVTGVLDVHDLHVWTVGPGVVACSCHVVVAEQSIREGQQVLRAVVDRMDHLFRITHTTVQVEVEGCEPNDMYCIGHRLRERRQHAR
jgi:cobalt-zinc-cadmium efflux system protein